MGKADGQRQELIGRRRLEKEDLVGPIKDGVTTYRKKQEQLGLEKQKIMAAGENFRRPLARSDLNG